LAYLKGCYGTGGSIGSLTDQRNIFHGIELWAFSDQDTVGEFFSGTIFLIVPLIFLVISGTIKKIVPLLCGYNVAETRQF
jgi:hypothetical protein